MMPLMDLASQQARIRPDLEARLLGVLDHGKFIAGPEIELLETQLTEYVGCAGVVCCSSGTDALVLALMALDIGPGDAVFVPALTFIASAGAIALVGARPVFVDVEPDSFAMSVEDLSRKHRLVLNSGKLRPRAVIPVDIFGMPADYDAISEAAEALSLRVVADAAQSFGARFRDKRVGALAELTCLSFYPGKALGGYGDGGAVATTSPEMLPRLRSFRWHGTGPDRRECLQPGINGRLDTLQAAILLSKMQIFDDELRRKTEIAARYGKMLGEIVDLQAGPPGAVSNWGYFCIKSPLRNPIRNGLSSRNVSSMPYYELPLSRMTAFKHEVGADDLPVTDNLSEKLLALPMHPYLTDDDVDRVCEIVHEAIEGEC